MSHRQIGSFQTRSVPPPQKKFALLGGGIINFILTMIVLGCPKTGRIHLQFPPWSVDIFWNDR